MKKMLLVTMLIVFLSGFSIPPKKKTPEECPPSREWVAYALNRTFGFETLDMRAMRVLGRRGGLIPFRPDMSHVWPEGNYGGPHNTLTSDDGDGFQLPSSYDLRSTQTAAKDQAGCNTCWDFACTGALEGHMYADWGLELDLSEEAVKECNYLTRGCDPGGTKYKYFGYATQGLHGEAQSIDTAYVASDSPPCPSATPLYEVLGWKAVNNAVANVKQAIYDYGPIISNMNAGAIPGFGWYDGTSCIEYPTTGSDHMVVIVGWDDSPWGACDDGHWIVKNSYGTSWGDNGYFYIEYGSGSVGVNICQVESYGYYNPNEQLYLYDECGWMTQYGFGDTDGYGLVKFTANRNETLTHIAINATSNVTNYEIKIFDSFDGTDVGNQLGTTQTGAISMAGYRQITLDTPIALATNDIFVVQVWLQTQGYNYPIAGDSEDTDFCDIEVGKTYVSDSALSGTWTDASTLATPIDVGIRARTTSEAGALLKGSKVGGAGSKVVKKDEK